MTENVFLIPYNFKILSLIHAGMLDLVFQRYGIPHGTFLDYPQIEDSCVSSRRKKAFTIRGTSCAVAINYKFYYKLYTR